jgi:hypothetical protein
MYKKILLGGLGAVVVAGFAWSLIPGLVQADAGITLGDCGTDPVIDESANAYSGKVTVGSGVLLTSCTIHVNETFGYAVPCTVTGDGGQALSATTEHVSEEPHVVDLVVTGVDLAGDTIMYHCHQQ